MNKKPRFDEELESALDNEEFYFIAGVICIGIALALVAVWALA